jgi:hypothetical protein
MVYFKLLQNIARQAGQVPGTLTQPSASSSRGGGNGSGSSSNGSNNSSSSSSSFP